MVSVQDVRALAVTGKVLRGEGKSGLAPKCRPLSQSAGFAEAYVAQTDLPSDHLQHIKNLVSAVLLALAAPRLLMSVTIVQAARAAEERENSDLSAAQEWM